MTDLEFRKELVSFYTDLFVRGKISEKELVEWCDEVMNPQQYSGYDSELTAEFVTQQRKFWEEKSLWQIFKEILLTPFALFALWIASR